MEATFKRGQDSYRILEPMMIMYVCMYIHINSCKLNFKSSKYIQ
jgi:hypothetical protein